MQYKHTHQSIEDSSPAMFVGDDVKNVGYGIYMNENGDLFTDPVNAWVPYRITAEWVVDSIGITLADYANQSIKPKDALAIIADTMRAYSEQGS